MRGIVFTFLVSICLSAMSQFVEDFSDGDFTNDPGWSGDIAEFLVLDGKLRSNGPEESSMLHLSTSSAAIENASWSFLIELGFAPSSTNQVRVYLVSDEENLEGDLNGYFIEIGQSGDDQIKFYRQDGASKVLLFTGATTFSGQVTVRLNVSRDLDGQWFIQSDPEGGNTLISEGEPFIDDVHTSSRFFGIVCSHSRTRNDLFYFDDFVVTGTEISDRVSPQIQSVSVLSSSQIEVVFTERLDSVTAVQPDNYIIDNQIAILGVSMSRSNAVVLQTTELTNGESYLLQVTNVEDENDNAIEPASALSFEYLVISQPAFREVVINEIFSNQMDDQSISHDFIEL